MGKRLLKVGDVFLIEKGQKLYVKAHGMSSEEVVAGEPTCHYKYVKDKIVVEGKAYFSELYLKTVKHVTPKPGEYVAIATSYEGGGIGGGMNGHDDYPDGHKVTAKRVDGKGPTVSFYQTGCFTAMLENPKVVSKAVKRVKT